MTAQQIMKYLLLLIGLVLAGVHFAEAQTAKVYQIGVLSINQANIAQSTDSTVLKGLRDGLKEAGYVEGKNLILDIPLKRTYEDLRSLAKEYREQKVDAIVAVGGTATRIAKEVTREIPMFLYMPATL